LAEIDPHNALMQPMKTTQLRFARESYREKRVRERQRYPSSKTQAEARAEKTDPIADEHVTAECLPPKVKKGRKCVDSPDHEPASWGLRSKNIRARDPAYKTANEEYKSSLRAQYPWASDSKQQSTRTRDDQHAYRVQPQQFPNSDGSVLGDNFISDFRDSKDAKTSTFADRLIAADTSLRSRTPPVRQP